MTFYHLKKTACPGRFRFLRYLRRTVQKIAKNRKKTVLFQVLSQIFQKKRTNDFTFFFRNCSFNDILSPQKTACPESFRFLRYLRRTVQKIARNHKNLNFFKIDGKFFKKQLKQLWSFF